MTKIYSLNSDVKFPDMEHYDMGKVSDMALYLAHCDNVNIKFTKMDRLIFTNLDRII